MYSQNANALNAKSWQYTRCLKKNTAKPTVDMIDILNKIFLNLIDFSSSIKIKWGSRCTSISFFSN